MKHTVFLSLLVLTLLLSGCGAGQPARLEYIGADSAKAAAVEAAGFQAGQVSFSSVDMGTREGLDYYHVEFTADGQTYRYDIDALTGTVIEAQGPEADASHETSSAQAKAPQTEKPASLPQEGSPSTEDQPANEPAETHTAEASRESPGTAKDQPTEVTEMLTPEEAQQAALDHAGLTADQVTFVKSGLDWDDGRETYDLEFYTSDYREFDYDIDPFTGEVISFDYDAEYYAPPASSTPSVSNNGGGNITPDEAKAIALAQVPGATVDDIWEFETDYDDGRLEYEGKIYYDHMEYEFEIDGYSGAIRSWDVESIYD